MRKRIISMLAAALMVCSMASGASAFLYDWKLDTDGAGVNAPVVVGEYLDVVGNSFISNTFTSPTQFNFTDYGFFKVMSYDGTNNLPSSHEITATFEGYGSGTLGNAINFSGGTLSIFSDAAKDYGTTAGFFGANNGTLIGTFDVQSGYALVDNQAVPNGLITLNLHATQLAEGYWFDSFNRDLSDGMVDITLGFATTNASLVSNAGSTLVSELQEFSGITPANTDLPDALLVSNNGQYRLAAVPEPSTFALIGLGFIGLGLGAYRRKR